MRWSKLLLFFFVFGCENKASFNDFSALANSYGDKVIIISCVRCGCTIDDLNDLILKNDEIISGYKFLGDTSCLQKFLLKNQVKHISQRKLDSISVDFYNLLVYKKNGGKADIKMIKTEDSKKIKGFL